MRRQSGQPLGAVDAAPLGLHAMSSHAELSRDLQRHAVGQGPAVVLLHGSADSPAAWAGVARLLSAQWTVFALPLPSLPDTDGAPLPALDADLPWLDTVMAETGARLLAAHSYGALLALRWALRNSSRLDGLVLAEPIAWGLIADQPAGAHKLAELEQRCVSRLLQGEVEAPLQWLVDYWNGEGFWVGLPERVRVALRATAPRTRAEVHSGGLDRTSPQELRGLTVPTALLAGSATTAESLAVSRQLAAHLPNAQLTLVAGAGHQFLRSHADVVAAAVRSVAGTVTK